MDVVLSTVHTICKRFSRSATCLNSCERFPIPSKWPTEVGTSRNAEERLLLVPRHHQLVAHWMLFVLIQWPSSTIFTDSVKHILRLLQSVTLLQAKLTHSRDGLPNPGSSQVHLPWNASVPVNSTANVNFHPNVHRGQRKISGFSANLDQGFHLTLQHER